MTKRLAALLLALPLLAFDCGGDEPRLNPLGTQCWLDVGGAASEELWCIATAYDYSDLDPAMTDWVFQLVAYRGMTEVGAGAGFFLDGRPALGAPYGWTASTSNVAAGSALRSIGDMAANPPTHQDTHEAWAPMAGGDGVGSISTVFSRIPPPGAVGAQLLDVHGTLTGTLPAIAPGGAPVTFTATF